MTAQVSVLDLPPKNLQHRSAQLRDTFWKEVRLDFWIYDICIHIVVYIYIYMDLLLDIAASPQIFQVAE